MKSNDTEKYIDVGDLEEILSFFPQHYQLRANQVGNIAVYDQDDFIGYIDILTRKFEKWPR